MAIRQIYCREVNGYTHMSLFSSRAIVLVFICAVRPVAEAVEAPSSLEHTNQIAAFASGKVIS